MQNHKMNFAPPTDRLQSLPAGLFGSILSFALLGQGPIASVSGVPTAIDAEPHSVGRFQLVSKYFRHQVSEFTQTIHINSFFFSRSSSKLHFRGRFPQLKSVSVGCDQLLQKCSPKEELFDFDKFDDITTKSIQRLEIYGSPTNQLFLHKFPSILSFAHVLRELVVSGCDFLHSKLHGTFLELQFPFLQSLKLSDSRNLEDLYLGELSSLRRLSLIGNEHLVEVWLPFISGLTHIKVKKCRSLKSIARGSLLFLEDAVFAENRLLKDIDLSNCQELRHCECANNTSLLRLQLVSCDKLRTLTVDVCALLAGLDLSSCSDLRSLRLRTVPLLSDLQLSTISSQLVDISLTGTALTRACFSFFNNLAVVELVMNDHMLYCNLSHNPALYDILSSGNDVMTSMELRCLPALESLYILRQPSMAELVIIDTISLKSVMLSNLPLMRSLRTLCRLPHLLALVLQDVPLPSSLDLVSSLKLEAVQLFKCIGMREVWVNSLNVEVHFKECGSIRIASACTI